MNVWLLVAIICVHCVVVGIITGLAESPSLNFNEMMTKMADGINAFAKTLKGEDAGANE